MSPSFEPFAKLYVIRSYLVLHSVISISWTLTHYLHHPMTHTTFLDHNTVLFCLCYLRRGHDAAKHSRKERGREELTDSLSYLLATVEIALTAFDAIEISQLVSMVLTRTVMTQAMSVLTEISAQQYEGESMSVCELIQYLLRVSR
jgi:hypothetical protein